MEIQEMIEVLHHAEKGGAVECRLRTNADTWGEANPILWNFNAYDYRIKPEPKKRPMTRGEVLYMVTTTPGMVVSSDAVTPD